MVNQYYEAQVHDVFVIKGNAAVFKCNIPSFVSDHVEIGNWEDSQGGRYVPHPTDYGKRETRRRILRRTLFQPLQAAGRGAGSGGRASQPSRALFWRREHVPPDKVVRSDVLALARYGHATRHAQAVSSLAKTTALCFP